MLKKILGILLACLLIFVVLPVFAETLMTVGTKSDEVAELKKQLYQLGYYQTAKFTKTYTEDTAERVRQFQRLNGMQETGEVDDTMLTLIASGQAVKAPAPTPPPMNSPAPQVEIPWPSRDDEGYLNAGEPFVFQQDGMWVYLSEDTQIIITRREDASVPLIWFETDVRVKSAEQLVSVGMKRYQYPWTIAQENAFVLGFSDDFYGYRMSNKETVGIVIRNGEILSEKTNHKQTNGYPNLDMLVQFRDGRMQTMPCTAHTAAELQEMGALNVFSFGPILISGGEMNARQLLSGYYSAKEPRQALGMIEPGHYLLVTVLGRVKASAGTDLWHVAAIMLDRGVTEALNLDGGNTCALVFDGTLINRVANQKSARSISSMIGIR